MNTATTSARSRQRTRNNPTTTGFRVSDALWAILEPLIPVRVNTHRFGGGRPRVPDRRCADAIFYVLRTGCQWGALKHTDLPNVQHLMDVIQTLSHLDRAARVPSGG